MYTLGKLNMLKLHSKGVLVLTLIAHLPISDITFDPTIAGTIALYPVCLRIYSTHHFDV